MAGKSKRKRRSRDTVPRAVPSRRREQRVRGERPRPIQQRGTTLGERPPSPFGGLPVSELAILAGGIALVVGFFQGGLNPALIVGLVVCTLGVVEVSAREHFSGYRSHSTLLAGIPTVAIEVAIVAALGGKRPGPIALLAIVPVFATFFWLLRQRFTAARQKRIARLGRR